MSCNSTPNTLEIHLAPWTQNPFAWDTLDGNGCVKTEPYDELEWLSPYLRINYGISTICGGIFSFYLLYLVVFHTAERLLPYQKIILCCGITDVMYWVTENFCQFKAKQSDGVFLLRLDGPAAYFSREVQVAMTAIYVTSMCFVNTLLPAQTYFRFYALTRSEILAPWKTIGLVACSVVSTLPILVSGYLSYSNSAAVRPGYNYGELWFDQYPLPILIIGDITTIQLVTSVVPVAVIIFAAFLRLETGMTPTFCFMALSWIPIINPLLTMIVIVPYRRAVRKTLAWAIPYSKTNVITSQ
ncbi:unnamed protein product [Bursaphelenchus xylophilus]|uniref:(pine wood nematode) hypothetical protein n=1 Tax=Bursaphelenchus xylophilus TaxID=6326 RepID=A0A7I8X4P9_BURXY|nr:unnamed protein product [Bursaphelenchus xylophilus]CAG9128997.1 unnamed protein product [Bursaphelenchus xylophilus]